MHAVVHHQFGTGRGGLTGNDNSGGLSSWFVWTTLGLFAVAGQNLFLINTPASRESRIEVAGGVLVISTTGFIEPEPGGTAQHVQTVQLDGFPLARTWLTGNELHHRGRPMIALGPGPGSRGTDIHLPSTSTTPPTTTPEMTQSYPDATGATP